MASSAIDPMSLLRREAEARNLMPFIGAGFSKNIDAGMPNWDELIDIAADQLDYSPSVIRAQGDAYQIAELLEVKGQLNRFYRIVAEAVNSKSFRVEASRPHALLPYIDASAIFTTNWDGWIERAFTAQGIRFRPIGAASDLHEDPVVPYRSAGTVYTDAEVGKLRTNAHTDIYKFHGDLDRTKTLVFRESDYFERMRFESPLDIRLRAEILEKSVLFIGYSYRDMDVRLIWHRLSKSLEEVEQNKRPTSFFVTYGNFPLQRELFEQKNIEMISLDPRDKATSLANLFEIIIEAQ